MREDVHACCIEPDEPGLAGLGLVLDEALGFRRDLRVEGLHALLGEGTRVVAALLAPLAEAGVIRQRAVGRGRYAFEDAARTEILLELFALGVVWVLGLFLGVQMVEVAEELVEAVDGREEPV